MKSIRLFFWLMLILVPMSSLAKNSETVRTNTNIPSNQKTFHYNDQGLLTEIIGPGERQTRIDYDPRGQVHLVRTGSSRQVFDYDRLGQLKSIQDTSGISVFTADPFGRLNSMTYPDGASVNYDYYENGRIAAVTWDQHHFLKFGRDLLGQTIRMECPSGVFQILHDYDLKKLQRKYPNGAIFYLEANTAGRPTLIQLVTPKKDLFAEFRYAYNDLGWLITATEISGVKELKIDYEYDAYGQLLSARYSDGRIYRYQYDDFGNRIKFSDGLRSDSAQYDARDQLSFFNGQPVRHDGAGNLTAWDRLTFRFDDFDVLVQDSLGNYTYNALGLRVQQSGGAETTRFIHFLDDLPYVLAETGANPRRYLWIDGQCVGQLDAGNQPLYFFEDGLGSIRYAMDAQGNIVSSAEYTPFGAPLSRIPGARFGFAGEEQDESGKIYLRARYYLPQLGRFLSKDPIPPQLTDELKQNRYAYAANSPTNFRDSDGTYPDKYLDHFRDYMNLRDLFEKDKHRKYYKNVLIGGFGSNPADYSKYLRENGGDFDLVITLGTGSFVGDLVNCLPDYLHSVSQHVEDILNEYQGTHWGVVVAHSWAAMAFKNYIDHFPGSIKADKIIYLGAPEGYSNKYSSTTSTVHLHAGDPVTWLPKIETSPENNAIFAKWTFRWGPGYSNTNINQSSFIKNAHKLDGYLNQPELREFLDRSDFDSNIHNSYQVNFSGNFESKLPTLTSSPNVGGVYLDKTAEIIGDLANIEGVSFDPLSKKLVLIGSDSAAVTGLSLRLDDLATAFRTARPSAEFPGVSIDPDSINPHADTMHVRFLGGVENTHFGQVLFEADRTMKALSLGQDNITHAPVTANVPGFYDLLKLSFSNLGGDYNKELWSRFWLVPDTVVIQVADDRKTIRFPETRIRVKTETMKWDNGKLVPAGDLKDEKAEYFAAHFTQYYDDYARQFPVFAELKNLVNLVALARWLQDNGSQLDFGWLARFDTLYTTARSTPSLTVSARNLEKSDNTIYEVEKSIFGGTDLTVNNLYLADNGTAARLASEVVLAILAEPLLKSQTIPDADGTVKRALPLPSSRTRVAGAKIIIESELMILDRSYCSFHNAPGAFGHSWVPDLPQLEFITPDLRQTEKVAMNNDTVTVRHYRFSRPFGLTEVWFRNYQSDPEFDRIAFLPTDFSSGIRALYPDERRGEYRLVYTDGREDVFNGQGQIIRRQLSPENALRYDYDDHQRLVVVTASRADTVTESVHLSYDDQGRIISARATADEFAYEYDAHGDLRSVSSVDGTIEYDYDARHLITGIAINGHRAAGFQYDEFGRLLAQNQTELASTTTRFETIGGQTVISEQAGGQTWQRIYDSGGNLLASRDPSGQRFQAQYYETGALKEMVLRNAFDDSFRVTYSPDSRHLRWTNAEGQGLALLVDDLGRLRQIQDDSTALLNREYVRTQDGWLEETRTGEVKIQNLFNSDRKLVEAVISSSLPAGGFLAQKNLLDPNGQPQHQTLQGLVNSELFFRNGRPVRQVTAADSTIFTYAANGRPEQIHNRASQIQFAFDSNDQISTITLNPDQSNFVYEFSGDHLKSRRNALGLLDQYQYSEAGLLTQVLRNHSEKWEVRMAENQIDYLRNDVLQLQYVFDDQGRLVSMID